MNIVKENLVKLLRETADKIDAGNSEIEEEQALEILKLIAHEPVSKERAAIELKISPSRFDALVAEGKLPKGRKRTGWKELCWYKDELDKCKAEYNL